MTSLTPTRQQRVLTGDRPTGKLHDISGAIGMVRIPGAGIEDPLIAASSPRTMRDHGQAVLGNPAWKIEWGPPGS